MPKDSKSESSSRANSAESTAKGYVCPELLWSPAQLEERVHEDGIKVVDVRVGEAYALGHIPDASHFSVYGVNTYDTDDAPLESFTRMWAFLIGQRGVSFDDTIVIYGDVTGMCAARAFWCLEYLGHRDVHVLDGGFRAWVRAGLSVTRDAELPRPVKFSFTADRTKVATYHDVLDAVSDASCIIVDTRTHEEWAGTDARAARNGTIPGAVHLYWGEHLTAEGQIRTADELRALFRARGVTPDKEVIALCNTGYRSAHAYLALRLLGYPRVRNYVASWQEWGNRDGCPVVIPEATTARQRKPYKWERLSSSTGTAPIKGATRHHQR